MESIRLSSEVLDRLADILQAGSPGAGGVGEPETLHRKGHWFESSIAHFGNSSHNISWLIWLTENIMSSIDPAFARRRDFKHMDNVELLKKYETELTFRLRNPKNLSDTRKMLAQFKNFLAGRPPSPDLAKEFLEPYAHKKPKTLYRYAQMIKSFLKWYGQPMDDFKVKIQKRFRLILKTIKFKN